MTNEPRSRPQSRRLQWTRRPPALTPLLVGGLLAAPGPRHAVTKSTRLLVFDFLGVVTVSIWTPPPVVRDAAIDRAGRRLIQLHLGSTLWTLPHDRAGSSLPSSVYRGGKLTHPAAFSSFTTDR